MERAIDYQDTHLMTDEWKGFMSVGREFAAHDAVRHNADEYSRGIVHANSVESFNNRVRRTIAGVFHHISPEHADLYFNEIGFRWSQREVAGQTVRRSRKGRESVQLVWSRIAPALQLQAVLGNAVGRQMRRSPLGGASRFVTRTAHALRVCFEIQGCAFLRMRFPPMATRIMA
jgi:hypothetical protein